MALEILLSRVLPRDLILYVQEFLYEVVMADWMLKDGQYMALPWDILYSENPLFPAFVGRNWSKQPGWRRVGLEDNLAIEPWCLEAYKAVLMTNRLTSFAWNAPIEGIVDLYRELEIRDDRILQNPLTPLPMLENYPEEHHMPPIWDNGAAMPILINYARRVFVTSEYMRINPEECLSHIYSMGGSTMVKNLPYGDRFHTIALSKTEGRMHYEKDKIPMLIGENPRLEEFLAAFPDMPPTMVSRLTHKAQTNVAMVEWFRQRPYYMRASIAGNEAFAAELNGVVLCDLLGFFARLESRFCALCRGLEPMLDKVRAIAMESICGAFGESAPNSVCRGCVEAMPCFSACYATINRWIWPFYTWEMTRRVGAILGPVCAQRLSVVCWAMSDHLKSYFGHNNTRYLDWGSVDLYKFMKNKAANPTLVAVLVRLWRQDGPEWVWNLMKKESVYDIAKIIKWHKRDHLVAFKLLAACSHIFEKRVVLGKIKAIPPIDVDRTWTNLDCMDDYD